MSIRVKLIDKNVHFFFPLKYTHADKETFLPSENVGLLRKKVFMDLDIELVDCGTN